MKLSDAVAVTTAYTTDDKVEVRLAFRYYAVTLLDAELVYAAKGVQRELLMHDTAERTLKVLIEGIKEELEKLERGF